MKPPSYSRINTVWIDDCFDLSGVLTTVHGGFSQSGTRNIEYNHLEGNTKPKGLNKFPSRQKVYEYGIGRLRKSGGQKIDLISLLLHKCS